MNLPIFDNYWVDLYAILMCIWLFFHALRSKCSQHLIYFSLAQIILFTLNFLNSFVNKGYCLFESCEPTHLMRHFFNVTFGQQTIILIRFISMSLMFVAIIKMHTFIENSECKPKCKKK